RAEGRNRIDGAATPLIGVAPFCALCMLLLAVALSEGHWRGMRCSKLTTFTSRATDGPLRITCRYPSGCSGEVGINRECALPGDASTASAGGRRAMQSRPSRATLASWGASIVVRARLQ